MKLHLELDPSLLAALAEKIDVPWILVTADDQMPGVHREVVTTLGLTIATIDGRHPPGSREDERQRDAVHRWAHVMQAQPELSIRRYSPSAYRNWTRRRS